MARRRRLVLSVWAALLVACAALYPMLEDRLGGMDFGVEGSESAEVDRVLAEHFPQVGAEQDVIVFQSQTLTADNPQFRTAVERTQAAAQQVSGVRSVVGPYAGDPRTQISPDGRVAIAMVGLDGDMADRAAVARALQDAVADSGDADVDAALTGYSPVQNDVTDVQNSDVKRAEMIGVPVALGLLVLALGAVLAAVVPIGVALAGLLLAAGVMFALTTVTAFDSLVVSTATMIGVGVGIDYALFIVSRFREELKRAGVTHRVDPRIAEAVGRSLATAGKTVIASGIIVMISLCALVVMQAPIFRGIALGVSTAVSSTLVVGLTLLPALLATLGPAVNRGALPTRMQPAEVTSVAAGQSGRWARWAYAVMARPVIFGGLAAAILVLAAMPIFGIRYGLDMGTSALGDKPSGRASAVLSTSFAPGMLSPIEIVASGPANTALTADDRTLVEQFLADASRDERIDTLLPAQHSDGRLLVAAVTTVPFDSMAATELVRDLRARAAEDGRDGGPMIQIGGSTAEFVDLDQEMLSKLPLVIILVLGASVLFLIAAFRSIVLPIKAILMNILATGAALGITVAVFQWGIGETLLDFTSPGFLQVYLPTVVFAVLFGLSMDYEVFLIRRIREYWESSNDNQHAVAAGLTHTARPITAAAAIMVVVFGSFVTADVLELKQLGFALAVAVAIDAVIVRLVLVPALMRLFGTWNWWFPRWGKAAAQNGSHPTDTVR
ncbi:MMPL family transporter [Mycolicibacterium novocastrense]|uniref:MMPL family transporter n=1 Tax=Mycolicibacterium novocastrense TaxID=59813 RepID=A0AAW5SL98_MYCNV|nr:MMPL family transporter [Mycolicibacterium novocastrense]MCV7024305.1 MMPL family transporter [Mycolicibacterium novocastrense]